MQDFVNFHGNIFTTQGEVQVLARYQTLHAKQSEYSDIGSFTSANNLHHTASVLFTPLSSDYPWIFQSMVINYGSKSKNKVGP